MRISDWSSDVCSSDLAGQCPSAIVSRATSLQSWWPNAPRALLWVGPAGEKQESRFAELDAAAARAAGPRQRRGSTRPVGKSGSRSCAIRSGRSEENTSELQSLMRISYAVFCLKQKTKEGN